jgi:hypothetical protein
MVRRIVLKNSCNLLRFYPDLRTHISPVPAIRRLSGAANVIPGCPDAPRALIDEGTGRSVRENPEAGTFRVIP